MECRQVRDLLSGYHDNELSGEMRLSVGEHVQECADCRGELGVFEAMSGMARELDDPEPPARIWAGIEAEMDADGERKSKPCAEARRQPSPARWRMRPLLIAAAAIMIAAGIGWSVIRSRLSSGHPRELAANFEEYLAHFGENPEEAQKVLLAKYEGRPVDLAEAGTLVGYRPAVAAGLPKRYSLDAVYVLNMPCCTCVQSICRRDDGQVFAIFEHNEEQPDWYGDLPSSDAQCNGRSCCVVQADQRIVASWKANRRQVAVVGGRDLDDIADLVTHLQTGPPEA